MAPTADILPQGKASSYRAREVRVLPGIFPHLFHGGVLYASAHHSVLRSADLGQTWEKVCELPMTPLDLATRLRWVDRIFNCGILNLTLTANGTLLFVAKRRVFRFRPAGPPPEPVFSVRHKHSPMHRGLCASRRGTVYLAEYKSNPRREPVHIYQSQDDGMSWGVAYRFAAGEIRHVHAIQEDPAADRIWVLTGDIGEECRIAFTTDGFRTLQTVGSGDQRWRATALLFKDGYLYWGMDSPLETSYIQRWDPTTGKLERLQELDGPAYYGAANERGHLFFGTTVERGPGVKDRTARIWMSPDGEGWEVLCRYDAGLWPQHGILYFPSGVLPGDSLVHRCRALAGVDHIAFVSRIERR